MLQRVSRRETEAMEKVRQLTTSSEIDGRIRKPQCGMRERERDRQGTEPSILTLYPPPTFSANFPLHEFHLFSPNNSILNSFPIFIPPFFLPLFLRSSFRFHFFFSFFFASNNLSPPYSFSFLPSSSLLPFFPSLLFFYFPVDSCRGRKTLVALIEGKFIAVI